MSLNKWQLVTSFSVGVLTAYLAQFAYNYAFQTNRKSNVNTLNMVKKDHRLSVQTTSNMESSLLDEQLSRIHTFFGDKGFEIIRNAFVIVVGVGGVGSHAAHMLARSGISKLRIIDFDQVTLSSLNRHAVATRSDVGLSKVYAMKKHLLEIVPHCEIEDIAMLFDKNSADELLDGNPSYVLDCIDDVNTKVALLEAATRKNLRIITATGAGAKSDPTRLQIGTLDDVIRDPLATKIKYVLRRKNISTAGITTVYSSEQSVCKLLPLEIDQKESPQDFGNMENFRVRVIPVLGTTPALFGQSMAAYVLCALGQKLFVPEAIGRLSRDVRNKLHQKLQDREHRLFHENKRMDLDKDEAEFIAQEIWKGRSSVSGSRLGGRDRLYLARWDITKPLVPNNVVYLTTKELDAFDKDGMNAFSKDIVERINKRLKGYGPWIME